MGGVGLTCRPGAGSRCAVARCPCCWHGCTAPSRPGTARRWSARRSPTGWWPSSRCRSRAGGAGRKLEAVMLEEVRITGLGVIDDALLELSPGFTALTGETGAGKTMVVTGLGLLFGGRADPARVRPGAQRASVDGRLRTDPDGRVARQVEEAGGELDEDGSLMLTRPVSVLNYLADDLVAVHGQSDQQQLLRPGRQREALDRYAGPELTTVLADYQAAYNRHRKVHDELATLTSEARSRAAEAEALRAGLIEIEKLEPV